MATLSTITPIHIEGSLGTGRRALFLDRDGVINEDHGYVGTWDRFDFVPGALEGIAIFNTLGYRVIVVTNQSGIGRGFYTRDTFVELSKLMMAKIADYGARVDAVYACPHYNPYEENYCNCRKPKPGMILDALAKYNLSAELSFLVGDKESDIRAAKAARIDQATLVTKCMKNPQVAITQAKWSVRNLIEFAQMIQKSHAASKSGKE